MQCDTINRWSIVHQNDALAVVQTAEDMTKDLGFTPVLKEEVILVLKELISNLLKHAMGGDVILTPLKEGQLNGLQIETIDNGPGIRDIEQAVTDGYSTTDSLGYGLGTAVRLMDVFHVESLPLPAGGTRVVCKKWKRESIPSGIPSSFQFGAVTRPHPKMELNGDAFVIKEWDQHALVGVIDGLGHGLYAHQASEAARDYIERHYRQPLQDIFLGVDRICRSTRGVVMALARLNNPENKMIFGSVGNIECRVVGAEKPLNFIMRRGVIGNNAPKPRITEHEWDTSHIMILHSDGVSSRWRWSECMHLANQSASHIAQHLIRKFSSTEDDATVLVVKRN